MRNWFAAVRRLTGHDDAHDAFAREERAIRSAVNAPLIDPRIVADSRRLLDRADPTTVVLGNAVADPTVSIALDLLGLPGSTHALIQGASGLGKSYLLAALCRQVVRAQLAGASIGLVQLDPKSDISSLVLNIAASELLRAPAAARERFISGFRFIDPFDEGRPPVPLNVLAPIPGVPPTVQAFDISTALEHMGGEGMGVRQGGFLYHAVLAGIGRATLPALYELTGDATRLVTFAAGSEHSDVRSFFTGQRIPAQSLEGVRARLHAILRVPAARRSLEAPTCLSFPDLLGNKVTLIATGNPPLGSEDVGRMFNLLFTMRLGNAILSRRQAGEVPVLVVADEFQEMIAANATTFERLLNLSRSRRVALVLATQTLASVGRINGALPAAAVTNAGVLISFRSAPADFGIFADALPVTGRRRRPEGMPWEERHGTPFLTTDEERRALLAEGAALPARTMYAWDRRRAGGAVFIRTADVEVDPRAAPLGRDLLGQRPGETARSDRRGAAAVCAVSNPPKGRFVMVRRNVVPAHTANPAEPAVARAAEEPRRRGRSRPRRRRGS